MTVGHTVKREMRVAISKNAQPVWFRILKWVFIIVLAAWLWRSRYFWWVFLGLLAISLAMHFTWRWKTRGWTQPWGGWNDVEAGRDDR